MQRWATLFANEFLHHIPVVSTSPLCVCASPRRASKVCKVCKFALHASALRQCHASSSATPTEFLTALCKTPAKFDAHSQVLVKDTKVWEAITPACLAREGVDPATNVR